MQLEEKIKTTQDQLRDALSGMESADSEMGQLRQVTAQLGQGGPETPLVQMFEAARETIRQLRAIEWRPEGEGDPVRIVDAFEEAEMKRALLDRRATELRGKLEAFEELFREETEASGGGKSGEPAPVEAESPEAPQTVTRLALKRRARQRAG